MARNIVTIDNIPEWAIGALEYGGDECGALTEEDIALVNAFVLENFPNGYCMSVKWDSYSGFTTHPAFGKACGTYEVDFVVDNTEKSKITKGQYSKVIAYVNHDPKTIASHIANHPETIHITEDIRTLKFSPPIEHLKKK